MTPILSHTYCLESKLIAKYIWKMTSYIFYDPYSKPYVWPRIDLYIEKVQQNTKYVFDDPHSEPYVWPRIEIDR